MRTVCELDDEGGLEFFKHHNLSRRRWVAVRCKLCPEARGGPSAVDRWLKVKCGGGHLVYSRLKPGCWEVEGILGTHIPVAAQILSIDENHSFGPALRKIGMGAESPEFSMSRHEG